MTLARRFNHINPVNPQHFYDLVERYRAQGNADPVNTARILLNSGINSAEARRMNIPIPYQGFTLTRSVAEALRPQTEVTEADRIRLLGQSFSVCSVNSVSFRHLS